MNEHGDVLTKDTGPLQPEQLSAYEVKVILDIEDRLREVCRVDAPEEPKKDALHYLSMPLNRSPRVLLLDGDRGTGKSSLLFTLAERWRLGITESSSAKDIFIAEYDKRQSGLGSLPDYIRTLPLLDFDPLPPGVPLIGAILQAWRPLVEEYDHLSGKLEDCALEASSLMDEWHRLFQFAVNAWTDKPGGKNLIEQILDREEQAKDWQRFREQWRSFVNKVFAEGKCLKVPHKLTATTVFVSMIDDVDLQVERVRELLPALRMLYHPRVVFIIGAHQDHMLDMLELDVFGRQNKLACHTNRSARNVTDLAKNDHWASALTRSSFEKVFVKRNQWTIEFLSISDFLAFPGHSLPLRDKSRLRSQTGSRVEEHGQKFDNFYDLICRVTSKTQRTNAEQVADAGEQIIRFAHQAEKAKLPGVMPYRTAEQLRHYLSDSQQSAPLKVIAELVSSGRAPHQKAVVQDNIVNLPITGQLSALYQPTRTEPTGSYNIVLSSQSDFIFEQINARPIRMRSEMRRHNFNFTGALIGKTLEESGFPVSAAGLAWETYLSLAWTEWPYLGTSFAWTRHEHPRPDKLLEQTATWNQFIRIQIEPKEKLERYAFAWIYFQRLWSGDAAPKTLNPIKLSASNKALPWAQLLKFHGRNQQEWRERTLPLLARPELGFPFNVQAQLLKNLPHSPALKSELKRQRRRLITDAFVALYIQKYNKIPKLPADETVEETITRIDQVYRERHSGNSWMDKIENSKAAGKKRLTIKRVG